MHCDLYCHRGSLKINAPLEACLSSLAACEIATARYHAKKLGVDLQEIKFVRVEGSVDVRGFAGDPNVSPQFTSIVLEAEVRSSSSEEEIEKLKEAAHKCCPVYVSLSNAGIPIQSTWRKVEW